MPRVSVVIPTARYGGIDIIVESMKHQTFRDFEVLIADELHRKEVIEAQGFIYVEPPQKKEGMWWNLDASLNKVICQAAGTIIVQLNDYVYVPPDGIQKFVDRLAQEPMALISGVSDQYLAPLPDNPTGAYSVWNEFPGIPRGNKVFYDPRKESNNQGFYLTIPLLFEGNWAAYPKQAWIDCGGYDEMFDIGWGYDNNEFAERTTFFGYHVFLDTDNEVTCWSHIKLFDEQVRRDSAPNNNTLYNKVSRMWYQGLAPTKLNYA